MPPPESNLQLLFLFSVFFSLLEPSSVLLFNTFFHLWFVMLYTVLLATSSNFVILDTINPLSTLQNSPDSIIPPQLQIIISNFYLLRAIISLASGFSASSFNTSEAYFPKLLFHRYLSSFSINILKVYCKSAHFSIP